MNKEEFDGAAQLLHAAMHLSQKKWRGVQPRNPLKKYNRSKYGKNIQVSERPTISPQKYKEYCEKYTKLERKARATISNS